MKRGFFLSIIGFVLLIVIVWLTIRFWPKPSDTIYEYYRKEKWEKVIGAVKKLDVPTPEDLFYASYSLVRLNSELISKEPEDRVRIVNRFKKEYGISAGKSTESSGEFPVFEDPFLTQLRAGGYWRQKAVLSRLDLAGEWEDDISFLKDLKEFIRVNPITLGSSYSSVLKKILKRDTKLSDVERDRLSELLGFLSTREDSPFLASRFKNTGENTNVRSGPGTENPGKTRLKKGILLYALDKDPRSETVQGRKGNWIQVYIPELQISGWIFSHFLEEDPFATTKAEQMLAEFSQSERSQAWDFAFWTEDKIPPGFHGEYIPTEKLALDGDYGIVLYRSQNGKYKELCRIVEEPFRSLEFLAASLSGEETVPIFRLYSGRPGDWKPAYQIDLDRESVSINRNKYITGISSGKGRYLLGISSVGAPTASLMVGEKTVLQGIQPEVEFTPEEGNLFKLCLLQPDKKSGSNAAAFRFKFLF
ncbi:hypothetical protein EHQ53_16005 [Leptospira langatensis]|uniref:SH3b domain-containing protein n=1 Tax=Leptospira langatensis TaxID=2484983 RepID=A0A5F1ZPS1_9LEPT|nr:SH3 domain-containing protein [Leptospira langatensis]TGK05146.1 hypothetical protein EHO57_00245 [Leptospira langatensis]TGL38283.1 hypothetical protein EHQ53_16005 [Leptospira langatensis]